MWRRTRRAAGSPPTTTTSSANSSSMTGPRFVRSDRRKQRGVMLRLTSDPPNVGNAFAAMVAPDWRELDRKRYEFTYVRREFLGESRCFVFDVRPLREGKEGFVGRIWIEDRDYNLVRFNGASLGFGETLSGMLKRKLSFHMDGWRVNVAPGVWVPSVRLLGRNGSRAAHRPPSRPRSGKPGSRARHGSGDTRRRTPTGPTR